MENNNKPVVHLISKPDNMLKTIYTAARTCYSADTPFNIYESTDDEEKMLKLIGYQDHLDQKFLCYTL